MGFWCQLFVIANEKGIPYAEVPHNYKDQEDSKLNVVTDSIQMARDYILIKLFYVLGLWRKDHTDKIWETFLPETDISPRTRASSPRKPKRDWLNYSEHALSFIILNGNFYIIFSYEYLSMKEEWSICSPYLHKLPINLLPN